MMEYFITNTAASRPQFETFVTVCRYHDIHIYYTVSSCSDIMAFIDAIKGNKLKWSTHILYIRQEFAKDVGMLSKPRL